MRRFRRAKSPSRPRLRRRRDPSGSTSRADAASAIRRGAGALPAGLRETGRRIAPIGRAGLRPIGRAAVGIGRRVVDVLVLTADVLGEALDRAVDAIWSAGRRVGARGVLLAVAVGALVALAIAQFTDYRTVSAVTQDLDATPTGAAHLYLLLPLAAFAGGLLWLATSGGRPSAVRGFAALGAVVVLVTLAVDLPQGNSTGGFDKLYDQVDARIVGGFYAQLAAGMAMIVSGILLAGTHDPPSQRPARRAQ